MGDWENILRGNSLIPDSVSASSILHFSLCNQKFSEISMVLEAAQGLIDLSIPLSFCPSRTYHRLGFSSKCPSVLLLPVHHGTTGRTPRPPQQWAALPQWHQYTGLCQWDPYEQGLPCSRHGLLRHETSAALPRGAPAGNVILGMWARGCRPAPGSRAASSGFFSSSL